MKIKTTKRHNISKTKKELFQEEKQFFTTHRKEIKAIESKKKWDVYVLRWEKQLSKIEIAKRVKLSPTRVYKILKQLPYQIKKKIFFLQHQQIFKEKLSERDYKMCLMRWKEHKNSEEIGKELNLHTQYVYILLSRCYTLISKAVNSQKNYEEE